ncbi:MAG: hypothetical protein D6722_20940, partial [Bacteroidetes bacterium]
AWTGRPESPLKLSEEAFYAVIDKRQVRENGRYVKPENIADEENPDLLYAARETFPEIKPPAVWLPHGILGISNSEILVDTSGYFGPFQGQLFVGDQGQSKIMRVSLEKVNGTYQGVAFDFRAGFQSGVLRMTWGHDGSLYVGETNRGWGSAGTQTAGLERVVWSGLTPFEMQTVRAKSDGFEVEFTQPIDPASAAELAAYQGRSFIYKYHAVYGSPPVHQEDLSIKGYTLSEDGLRLRLWVENLRPWFIHELKLSGIRSAEGGHPLLHPTAYYTLNQIPEGDALPAGAWTSLKKPQVAPPPPPKPRRPAQTTVATAPTYAEVEPLLSKHTCTACHQTNNRQVGPAFRDIAKRGYSPERIVELIHQPEPQNWPDYSVPMAPMPHVPRSDALQIARWINTLK